MNLTKLKSTVWLASGAVALGLVGYVGLFVSRLEELRAALDLDRVRTVLENAPEPERAKDDLISYDDVKRLFHETRGLNWTGRPPEVEKPPTPGPEVAVPRNDRVAELLKILLIMVDSDAPESSRVIVRYTPKAGVPPRPQIDAYSYQVGDRLEKPHGHVRVDSITIDGVTFAFDDAEREAETLSPSSFDSGPQIVSVDPNGAQMPVQKGFPTGLGRRSPPGETRRVAPDLFRMGTDDMQIFAENYDRILSTEVDVRRHRDPNNGRYDGIEITDIKSGSIAERHGAQAGDVLKSINGHPVTSPSEAISYVKNNSGKFTKWEVVVERLGKNVTITYETP